MIGLTRRRTLWLLGITLIVIIIVSVAIIYTHNVKKKDSWKNRYTSSSSLGQYKKAAVVSMGPECSPIGVSMLEKGGSAVDAAIATLLCEGVASLHSMGLGGGFLMTIWNATTKTAHYLNARETASRHANSTMFQGNATLTFQGGLSVAVPGELLGYWEAHKRFGKLDWKLLFQPTIELCKKGSYVNNYLGGYIKENEASIRAEPTLSEILINPDTNEVYKSGDRIKRPQLAKTLEILSDSSGFGVKEFYNGSIARNLAREIQAFKGIIDEQDFSNYKVVWQDPLNIKMGTKTMYTAPPPGSGVILGLIMNVLNGFISNIEEKIAWQRIVETFKWAYGKRTELGDPAFDNEFIINDLIKNFTAKEYIQKIRNMIKDDWTSNDPAFYGARTSTPDDSGTCHVSVLAPDGSAVSVTSTINQVFGALFRSRSTGIIFNDEMDDFSSPNITNAFGIPPSPANYIQPGKRPLSSMTPTLLVNDKNEVELVVGGAGGTKITTAVAITMILHLWIGYDVKEAVDAYRLHHQLFPMRVQNEKGFPPSLLKYLYSAGHNVTFFRGIGSAIAIIAKQNDIITANSDYRRQGTTAGF